MVVKYSNERSAIDRRSDYDTVWQGRFQELFEYKLTNGNCLVPSRYSPNPTLGHWVMTQRRQYHLLKNKKTTSLTDERINELDTLGFSWVVRDDPEATWNHRYEDLYDYYKDNGDCLVPQRYDLNKRLGTWVNTQRREYKQLKKSLKSSMTPAKIKKLNYINFTWKSSKKRPKNRSLERVRNNVHQEVDLYQQQNQRESQVPNDIINSDKIQHSVRRKYVCGDSCKTVIVGSPSTKFYIDHSPPLDVVSDSDTDSSSATTVSGKNSVLEPVVSFRGWEDKIMHVPGPLHSNFCDGEKYKDQAEKLPMFLHSDLSSVQRSSLQANNMSSEISVMSSDSQDNFIPKKEINDKQNWADSLMNAFHIWCSEREQDGSGKNREMFHYDDEFIPFVITSRESCSQ